jgi:hypothetical protein
VDLGDASAPPTTPWDGRAISVVGAVDHVGMRDGTAVPYTLAISPLAFLPAAGAGIDDQRGRFREILCAVDEARGDQAVYLIGAASWCAMASHPHFTPTVVSAWSHPGLSSLA